MKILFGNISELSPFECREIEFFGIELRFYGLFKQMIEIFVKIFTD